MKVTAMNGQVVDLAGDASKCLDAEKAATPEHINSTIYINYKCRYCKKSMKPVYSTEAAPGMYLIANPNYWTCLLYTSPSPRDRSLSRMPSSA